MILILAFQKLISGPSAVKFSVFCFFLRLFRHLGKSLGIYFRFFSYYSLAPLLNEIKKIMEISNL